MLKVLFVQGGLPSYFKFILNRLNEVQGLEVIEIIPSGKGTTLGAGVQVDTSGADFEIVRLEEYKTWYGKPFFRNFEQTVSDTGAQIILLGWPYMMFLAFNPLLVRRLRKKGVKIIHRDIPFNTPAFGKTVSYYRQNLNRQENMGDKGRSWPGLLVFLLLTRVRRIYLRLADAHIYYTDDSRQIIGSYGVDADKIFVSANSPDTDLLLSTYAEIIAAPLLLPVNNCRLIHVGRLVKWKRVDLILTAMQQLQKNFPAIELVIAGFGPEEEALKAQARELGLESQVKFLGGVYDPAMLGRYLNESAVYVLAGMGGLSINDAMCFAKPVICSEADGTEKRLVRDGFNGYYFQNGNAADLAAKISVLISDPGKVTLFGFRSLEIIKNEVNIQTVIREYVNAFNFTTGGAFPLTLPGETKPEPTESI